MFATLRYGQNSTLVEQVNQTPRLACINCRSRKVIVYELSTRSSNSDYAATFSSSNAVGREMAVLDVNLEM